MKLTRANIVSSSKCYIVRAYLKIWNIFIKDGYTPLKKVFMPSMRMVSIRVNLSHLA